MPEQQPLSPDTPFSPHHGVYSVTPEALVEQAAAALRTQLAELIADPACSALVIDTSRLTFIDATGVGVLVGAAKRALRADKPLVIDNIDNPYKPIGRTLAFAGLGKTAFLLHAGEPSQIE